MLKQKNRLKNSEDFLQTKTQGNYLPNRYFHLYYLNTQTQKDPQIGIVVSNKFDNRATKRNRAKRIIRDILRKNSDKIPLGVNIVIYPKFSVLTVKNEELSTEITKTLQKIHIT